MWISWHSYWMLSSCFVSRRFIKIIYVFQVRNEKQTEKNLSSFCWTEKWFLFIALLSWTIFRAIYVHKTWFSNASIHKSLMKLTRETNCDCKLSSLSSQFFFLSNFQDHKSLFHFHDFEMRKATNEEMKKITWNI